MRRIKNISFIAVYTILFTALIFIGRQIFFPRDISIEERFLEVSLPENYTEVNNQGYYSFSGSNNKDVTSIIHELIYESFRQKYPQSRKGKITFRYIPSTLAGTIKNSYLPLAELFLYKKNIFSHIENMKVFFYKNRKDTRGRMKSQNIHLFGVLEMSDEEFMSVLIHEFGHYFDIYGLPRKNLVDTSQKYYDISWKSVSVMLPGQQIKDFVSGYAMTNQYEDFAESYLYYITHNRDFLKKAQENIFLEKKYDFFSRYVFPKKQFYKSNFSLDDKIGDYYWDITKLPLDIKNFLQYLQKDL